MVVPQPHSIMRSAVFILGGVVALLTIVFMYWEDFCFDEKVVQYVDYRNSFYVAGLLVRQNRIADLYPQAGNARFHDTAFNRYAHQLLPQIPDREACNFLYPPLVAFFFAPLSWFAPRISTFVWQLFSSSALVAAVFLFARAAGSKYKIDEIVAASFLAFPLLHVLITGQLAVVFGLLPMAAGYFLYYRRRYVAAGLVWSFISIKLQLFFPLLCVVLAMFIAGWMQRFRGHGNGNWICARQIILGMLLGLMAFQVMPFVLAGPNALPGWLQATAMVAQSASSSSHGWAQHTIVSLPAAISFLAPSSLSPYANAISTVVALVASATALLLLVRMSTRGQELPALMVVAFIFLPLSAPYLRFYDYALFLFPAWIACCRTGGTDLFWLAARRAILAIFVSLNGYWLVLWMLGKHPSAQAVVWPLAVIVASIGYVLWATHSLDTSAKQNTEIH